MNELRKTKLIEIGNLIPTIIFTGDRNFPVIDWQMETAKTVEPVNIRFKQMPFYNLHRNNAYSNI